MSLLEQLERLARLQAELTGQAQACLGLIEAQELEPLEDLTRRRRELFAQVMAAYQELRRACPDLEAALAGLAPGQAQGARGFLQDLAEQTARLKDLDRQSAALLAQVLEGLRGQLVRLGQGQRMLNAYRSLPRGTRWGPDQLSRTG